MRTEVEAVAKRRKDRLKGGMRKTKQAVRLAIEGKEFGNLLQYAICGHFPNLLRGDKVRL